MSKPFFEVFPTLKAGEDIRNMFEGAQVLKVTTNSDRTFLRVHIAVSYTHLDVYKRQSIYYDQSAICRT